MIVRAGRQAGFKGLFAGLGPRMIMTAGLVAGQFLIYGAIKDGTPLAIVLSCLVLIEVGYIALGARPGVEIHKEEKTKTS